LGIGFVITGLHRGRIAIALRWPSAEIVGFGSVEGGKIKLPNNLSRRRFMCSNVRKERHRIFAGSFYLPERVVLVLVPFVDVPAGLPTPCGLLEAAPVFVPVVPCMPVVGELVADPVGDPAAVLFGDEVLVSGFAFCASAVPESVSAKAIANSFMGCPFIGQDNPLVFTTFRNASATEAAKPFA
jgi:hypothetical protein